MQRPEQTDYTMISTRYTGVLYAPDAYEPRPLAATVLLRIADAVRRSMDISLQGIPGAVCPHSTVLSLRGKFQYTLSLFASVKCYLLQLGSYFHAGNISSK